MKLSKRAFGDQPMSGRGCQDGVIYPAMELSGYPLLIYSYPAFLQNPFGGRGCRYRGAAAACGQDARLGGPGVSLPLAFFQEIEKDGSAGAKIEGESAMFDLHSHPRYPQSAG